jgi:hypothetical protein
MQEYSPDDQGNCIRRQHLITAQRPTAALPIFKLYSLGPPNRLTELGQTKLGRISRRRCLLSVILLQAAKMIPIAAVSNAVAMNALSTNRLVPYECTISLV